MFWSVHCKKHKLLYMFSTHTLILLLRDKKKAHSKCVLCYWKTQHRVMIQTDTAGLGLEVVLFQ